MEQMVSQLCPNTAASSCSTALPPSCCLADEFGSDIPNGACSVVQKCGLWPWLLKCHPYHASLCADQYLPAMVHIADGAPEDQLVAGLVVLTTKYAGFLLYMSLNFILKQ